MSTVTVQAGDDGRLRLEIFEGPLDLLLYLIRKSEIDVHDIPIALITQQYQALLERGLREGFVDLDFAGDYFLLAASLIQIKTRMLLPRPALDPLTGAPPEDPRQELVQQLLEYERFREAAMMLRERFDVAETMLTRPDGAVAELAGTEPALEVDLLSLARAFQKIMDERRMRAPHVLSPSRYTVRDRMHHVLGLLRAAAAEGRPVSFSGLFEEGTIEEAVATFLALLELVKRAFLRCRQARHGDDIELFLVPIEERPSDEMLAESEFDQPSAGDGTYAGDEGSDGADIEDVGAPRPSSEEE